MPSGKSHDRITLWLLPVVLAGSFVVTLTVSLTVIVSICFLIGGFMMGPDLDIHSVQYLRWGPVRWIWYPYQVLVKHRSPWSHGPLIGTLVRVLYFAAWVALFTVIGVLLGNHFWQAQISWDSLGQLLRGILIRYADEWLALLVGLELGALSHYTSDWLVSTVKKKKKRKRPRKSRKSSKSSKSSKSR